MISLYSLINEVTLKKWNHFRPLSYDEIRDEYDEFKENDKTKFVMPRLAKDWDDFNDSVKVAQEEIFSVEELKELYNSDVGEVLTIIEDGGLSAGLDETKRLSNHYGKDWKRIYKAFKSTPPMKLPLPLVVRDKNSDNYLLAGNTRLMVSVSLGYNMGINVIPYKYEFKSEGFYL